MAAHTTTGSVAVDAFQWLGGILNTSVVVLPVWAKRIAMHSPGDGTLHVPCPGAGTQMANPTDWVVWQPTTGFIDIIPNATWVLMFT